MEWNNPMTLSFLSDLALLSFTNDYKDFAIKGKIIYEVARFVDTLEKLKKEISISTHNPEIEKNLIEIYADYSLMKASIGVLNEILKALNEDVTFMVDVGFVRFVDGNNLFEEFSKEEMEQLNKKLSEFQKKVHREFIKNLSESEDEHSVVLQSSIYYDIERNYRKLMKNEPEKAIIIEKHQKYVDDSIKIIKKLLDKEEIIKMELMVSKNITDYKNVSKIYKLILAKHFLTKDKTDDNFFLKRTVELVDEKINKIIKNEPKLIDIVDYVNEEVKSVFENQA